MIEAQQLTKRHGATTAVDDLSFTVHLGQVTGFLGPYAGQPKVTRRLLDAFAGQLPAPGGTPADDRLDQLMVSAATVKAHVGRILSKLGLRDRVQIVVYAYESGLISPGD